MPNKKSWFFIILGVASIVGITLVMRKRGNEVPGLPIWQTILHKRYGAERTRQIAASIRQQYINLVSDTPFPENRTLQFHLKRNILPGLALYRILLLENDGNQQAALAEVDTLFRYTTTKKSRLLLAPLKIMPEPFQVFKLVYNKMMKLFPKEGWDFIIVENRDDKIAFNATRCYYLNTLTALGAPELTASFCKTDDVMAESFPQSIRFVRLHTLGRGDDVCDFQYCRAGK